MIVFKNITDYSYLILKESGLYTYNSSYGAVTKISKAPLNPEKWVALTPLEILWIKLPRIE